MHIKFDFLWHTYTHSVDVDCMQVKLRPTYTLCLPHIYIYIYAPTIYHTGCMYSSKFICVFYIWFVLVQLQHEHWAVRTRSTFYVKSQKARIYLYTIYDDASEKKKNDYNKQKPFIQHNHNTLHSTLYSMNIFERRCVFLFFFLLISSVRRHTQLRVQNTLAINVHIHKRAYTLDFDTRVL